MPYEDPRSAFGGGTNWSLGSRRRRRIGNGRGRARRNESALPYLQLRTRADIERDRLQAQREALMVSREEAARQADERSRIARSQEERQNEGQQLSVLVNLLKDAQDSGNVEESKAIRARMLRLAGVDGKKPGVPAPPTADPTLARRQLLERNLGPDIAQRVMEREAAGKDRSGVPAGFRDQQDYDRFLAERSAEMAAKAREFGIDPSGLSRSQLAERLNDAYDARRKAGTLPDYRSGNSITMGEEPPPPQAFGPQGQTNPVVPGERPYTPQELLLRQKRYNIADHGYAAPIPRPKTLSNEETARSARQYGIDLEGKTPEQMAQEIYAAEDAARTGGAPPPPAAQVPPPPVTPPPAAQVPPPPVTPPPPPRGLPEGYVPPTSVPGNEGAAAPEPATQGDRDMWTRFFRRATPAAAAKLAEQAQQEAPPTEAPPTQRPEPGNRSGTALAQRITPEDRAVADRMAREDIAKRTGRQNQQPKAEQPTGTQAKQNQQEAPPTQRPEPGNNAALTAKYESGVNTRVKALLPYKPTSTADEENMRALYLKIRDEDAKWLETASQYERAKYLADLAEGMPDVFGSDYDRFNFPFFQDIGAGQSYNYYLGRIRKALGLPYKPGLTG